MINLGLTFSGGGGKGAYEIGVWKALKEFGITNHIKAVSGTSVGALNAALFIGSDFDQGEKVWNTISRDDILGVESLGISPEKIAALLASFSIPGGPTLLAAFRAYALTGVFSQSGLEKIIRENIDFEKITKSNIPLIVCAYNWRLGRPDYITLNSKSPENIVQYLLASAALPIIWDPVVVEGTSYLDGGIPLVGDNIPVMPVIEQDCDTVISVILDQGSVFGEKEHQHGSTKFWKIIPKENQGGLFSGTLDFNPLHAKRRIDQGYEDTRRVLQNYYEFLLVEENYVKSAHEINRQDQSFILTAGENKLLRAQVEQSRRGLLGDQSSLQYLLSNTTSKKQTSIYKLQPNTLGDIEKRGRELSSLLEREEKLLINSSLDKTVKSMEKNSKEALEHAFEALTAIDPVEGRSRYIQDQGHVKRFINGFTGKNLKLIAESQHDIYKSVYATNQFMKKLAEKHKLSMEVLVSYGNKLEYLQHQIQHQSINMLAVFEGVRFLQASIQQLIQDLQSKLGNIVSEITALKRGHDILYWKAGLSGCFLDGIEYSALSPTEKVGLVISQYYQLSEGNITSHAFPFIRAALIELKIEHHDTISPFEFFLSLAEKSSFSDQFFSNIQLGNDLVGMNSQTLEYFPLLHGIKIVSNITPNDVQVFPGMISEVAALSPYASINTLNFAIELLFSLSKLKYFRQQDSCLIFQEVLDNCLKIEERNQSSKRVVEKIKSLKSKIETFKLIVPIIGPPNSGKSSLLNAYLGSKVLPEGLNIKTHFPIELHYSSEEKVLLAMKNGETVVEDLDFLTITEASNEDIAYAQVFLSSRALQMKDNMILVDMPQLDNNPSPLMVQYAQQSSYYIVTLDNVTQVEYNTRKAIRSIAGKVPYHVVITRGANVQPQSREEILESLAVTLPQAKGFEFVESKGRSKDLKPFEIILGDINAEKQNIIYEYFISDVKEIIRGMKNHLELELQLANEDFGIEGTSVAETTVSREKKEKQINAKLSEALEMTHDIETVKQEQEARMEYWRESLVELERISESIAIEYRVST